MDEHTLYEWAEKCLPGIKSIETMLDDIFSNIIGVSDEESGRRLLSIVSSPYGDVYKFFLAHNEKRYSVEFSKKMLLQMIKEKRTIDKCPTCGGVVKCSREANFSQEYLHLTCSDCDAATSIYYAMEPLLSRGATLEALRMGGQIYTEGGKKRVL